jgi:hypothetical protein
MDFDAIALLVRTRGGEAISMVLEIRDDRQMRTLTGLSQAQFKTLAAEFEGVYHAAREQAYEVGRTHGQRQRPPGGGQKRKLPTLEDKLLLVLYYLKVYPTYDVLGTQFGLSRAKAYEQVQKLLPLFYQTLVQLDVLPHRDFSSVDAFRTACEGLDKLIVDVTERNHQRTQTDAAQRDLYSRKKRGRTHDYAMLKHEFPPDQPWFEQVGL